MVGFNNNVDYVGGINLDPNAASDGTVQYAESTTAKWIHGNDATNDSFRLSQGSALGTNDTFIMTAAGERTMPLQPAFFAYQGTSDLNVTGNGTAFFLGETDVGTTLTEVFDQNGDFTPGASGGAIMTAPVTGIYEFWMNVSLDGLGAGHTSGFLRFVVSSGDVYLINFLNPATIRTGSQLVLNVSSGLIPLSATETVKFEVAVSNSTKTVDILNDASPQFRTFVSGRLVC